MFEKLKKNQNYIAYLIASLCFVLVAVLLLLSTGTYDPGDGVQHYVIAKYAATYPKLLLDHWGKPFYILLSMPFAQLGFLGSNFYNLICNTGTAILAFKCAKNLHIKQAWLAVPLVFFSPLLFMTNFSGLTEPTFALILTGALLLLINKQFVWSALLLSFLPFARTEGFFIIPIFIIYFIIQKQWKAILFTGFATLAYSIIGYFVLNDFLWIMHQNPYKGAFDIYGKGPLFHFVAANDRLFGLPLVVLFVAGIISLFKPPNQTAHQKLIIRLVILGSFNVYFIMHSVFWWKGLFGSLGLHRVMAAIAPLFSLIALIGLQSIRTFIQHKNQKLAQAVSIILVALVIVYPFKQYQFPLKPDPEMRIILEAVTFINENNISYNKKVYYSYPLFTMLLNVDVFNPQKQCSTCMLEYPDFIATLKPGDLIIWDSHFGHECKLTPDDIVKIKNVSQLFSANNYNVPNEKWKFEVQVFQVDP